MMALIALIQTPAPPDQQMGTALLITKMSGELARRIDAALTPTMGGNNPTGISLSTYMYWLFIILIGYGLLSLIWEAANILLDAGTEEHDGHFKRLADTGFLKKVIKFMILCTLGIGALFTVYKADPNLDPSTFKPLGVQQSAAYIASDDNIGGRLTEMMNPITKIVSPVGTPAAVDSSITGTIAKNSAKLGAYYLATQSQNMAGQAAATTAAETVWNDLHPNGTSTNPSLPEGRSWIGQQVQDIAGLFNAARGWLISSMSGFFLLWMNFGLDVLVVKTLVFNAIYLMMAYKVAVMILPVAFIAAYWHHWEGVLKGVIQTMIVATISLNVLADCTAILVSPDQITQIITDAQAQSQSADIKASMELYARNVYSEMVSEMGAASVTKQAFTDKVVNLLGDPRTARIFNFDTCFFVPLRVLMMFSILLVLIGKIGTVISDTISGSMSYHR